MRRTPRVYRFDIDPGYGEVIKLDRPASYTQIDNRGTVPVFVTINEDIAGATFELGPGEAQVFSKVDVDVMSLDIFNDSGTAAKVQVIVGTT